MLKRLLKQCATAAHEIAAGKSFFVSLPTILLLGWSVFLVRDVVMTKLKRAPLSSTLFACRNSKRVAK